MRVLVVGPLDADSFADNVISALRQMGHEVFAAGPARHTPRNPRLSNAVHILSDKVASLDEASQRHVVDAAAQHKPEVVLSIDSRLRPATVAKLKEHAQRVALWFPDHVANLGRHEVFLAPYDRIFFKNPDLVRQLTEVHGLPVTYMPEAANPQWHHPVGDYGTDPHIVVAGNVHPTRAALLRRLLQANVPLRIYGPSLAGWIDYPDVRAAQVGRSVHREEKSKVFRGARGVLNNLHPAEWSGSNCRLFEAAACGSAVLTEWRPAMSDLFDRETEVVSWTTFDELVDQCRFVLASDLPAQKIADAASVRAMRDHTYEIRLNEILQVLT